MNEWIINMVHMKIICSYLDNVKGRKSKKIIVLSIVADIEWIAATKQLLSG